MLLGKKLGNYGTLLGNYRTLTICIGSKEAVTTGAFDYVISHLSGWTRFMWKNFLGQARPIYLSSGDAPFY